MHFMTANIGHVELKQKTIGPMVLGAVQWKSDGNTLH
jgi:hypothetical protein